MAKVKTNYTCTECGGQSPKWQGQCPSCFAWNTLVETIAETPGANRYTPLAEASSIQKLQDVEAAEVPRRVTGIAEFDRVLGGGLVPGGVVLIGGDPGIGKSTLLLQTLCHLGNSCQTLYISGEESAQQIAMRAKRLGLDASPLALLAEINLEKIIDCAAATGTWIELNCSSYRMELDWRWWHRARDKGVLCSINPDAHSTARIHHIGLGVRIARKGWLRRGDVMNTLSLEAIKAELAR